MYNTNNILILSLVLDSDSYKFSHAPQYPPNTSSMFSYLEARGTDEAFLDKFDNVKDYVEADPIRIALAELFKNQRTVFFGLQYYMKRFLSTPITVENVEEASEFAKKHGVPFNEAGWMRIVNHYEGKLPVKIRAVREGSVIPVGNILMSVESTTEDEETFWLVSWLETMFVRLWYPITVATNSYLIKQIILENLRETCDDPDGEIGFKLHDFGSRGCTSQESAMISGASHLVNFCGSDTIAGIWMANEYYNHEMSGFSIPASEHSTMSMWKREGEVEAYRNMIKQYGDGVVFACVSDTWDIYNATENIWGEALKKEVQEMNALLVVRPDSGDAVKVPVELVMILDQKFGHTINDKKYKVLKNVRVIQGDGIDGADVREILALLKEYGYSGENMVFGMGGGLIQKDLNRDTFKFAFKCSSAVVDGERIEVYKEPITDAVKKSKRGELELVHVGGNKVYTAQRGKECGEKLMRTVYDNGVMNPEHEQDFEVIRRRTETYYTQHKGFLDFTPPWMR